MTTAAIYNARRTKRSDKWFTWQDFHPAHANDVKPGLSGRDVVAQVVAWWAPDQIEWAPGYSPADLN